MKETQHRLARDLDRFCFWLFAHSDCWFAPYQKNAEEFMEDYL